MLTSEQIESAIMFHSEGPADVEVGRAVLLEVLAMARDSNRAAALEGEVALLRGMVADLLRAMEIWGSWEDGVPASDDPGEMGVVGREYDDAKRYLAALESSHADP